MEDGDLEALLQPPLELEAAGRGDVLEVDTAVGRCDPGDSVDQLVDGPGLHAQWDRVDTTEPLEQHGFSLHDRHRGQGSDVAEAEDGGAVADDRDGVADARVGRGELRVRRDRAGYLGDAGRVEERQVRGVAQRLGRERGELAAQMGPEHGAGGVDERRGLAVHGIHLEWLAVDGPRAAVECSRGGGHEKRGPEEGVPPGSATVTRGPYPWVVNFDVPRCGPRHTPGACRSYTPDPMEAPSPARCGAAASTASPSTPTTSRWAGTGRRSSIPGRCRSSSRSASSTSSRRRASRSRPAGSTPTARCSARWTIARTARATRS